MHIGNKVYPLKHGDIILIPPGGHHHNINHNPNIPYRRFIFWISEEYYRQLHALSDDYGYIAMEALKQKQYIYHNDMISFNALQAKLFRLIEEIHSNRFGRTTKIALCVVIFKENMGLSIHQYITKKRLTMCRDALLSDTNISKAFLLYGFKDYSSFYGAFKKEYGIYISRIKF